MIVAGIGSRKDVTADEVLLAVDAALAAHGRAREALAALATTDFKRNEKAIFLVGEELGLPVLVVDVERRLPTTPATVSQAVAGVRSVSETAALAAAGAGGRLLGPRIATGRVTCALAVGEDRA